MSKASCSLIAASALLAGACGNFVSPKPITAYDIDSLNGKWEVCETNGQTSAKIQVSWDNGSLREQYQAFSLPDCRGTGGSTDSRAASYTLGKASAEFTREIDLNPWSWILTESDPAQIARFNLNKDCGHSDWVVNQPMDVTYSDCFDRNPYYGILQVDEEGLHWDGWPAAHHEHDQPAKRNRSPAIRLLKRVRN